jgi:PDZ domain-containing secreted protein
MLRLFQETPRKQRQLNQHLKFLNRNASEYYFKVSKLSKENRDLINQLKTLNENIDLLTKVTAISVGKETIFKGKKELGDKIEALNGLNLPDKIIALLVGSTPDSVKSLRSKKKARTRKIVQTEPKQEEVKQK